MWGCKVAGKLVSSGKVCDLCPVGRRVGLIELQQSHGSTGL